MDETRSSSVRRQLSSSADSLEYAGFYDSKNVMLFLLFSLSLSLSLSLKTQLCSLSVVLLILRERYPKDIIASLSFSSFTIVVCVILGEASSRVDETDGYSLQVCQSELVQWYVKKLFYQRCWAMIRKRFIKSCFLSFREQKLIKTREHTIIRLQLTSEGLFN